ncbi:MAG: DUF4468 domain-containing protein [Candidatus Kuenenia stuttgartiensis]|nr:DUF4468 domain-containing protein [Candidatus Kuenenia stuttgartiensis]
MSFAVVLQGMYSRSSLLVCFCWFSTLCKAQSFDVSQIPLRDESPFYELVVNADGVTKQQLFSAARMTMIKLYKDAKEVIQSEDKQTGEIIGKGYSTFSINDTSYIAGSKTYMFKDYRMWFIVSLTVKDERYRIQIFEHGFDQKTRVVLKLATSQTDWTGTTLPYSEYANCISKVDTSKKKVEKELHEYSVLSCMRVIESMHHSSINNIELFISQMENNIKMVKEDW